MREIIAIQVGSLHFFGGQGIFSLVDFFSTFFSAILKQKCGFGRRFCQLYTIFCVVLQVVLYKWLK